MAFDLPEFSVSTLQPMLEIGLAMLLGGAVGFERERADKPAGLRTHMLLAGTAALLVALGQVVIAEFSAAQLGAAVSADPLRIFQAIITGIGILAAGTIFRRGTRQVEGLTTAASLLFVGAIGIAVAVGEHAVAAAATLLALLALRLVRLLETRKAPRSAATGAARRAPRPARVARSRRRTQRWPG